MMRNRLTLVKNNEPDVFFVEARKIAREKVRTEEIEDLISLYEKAYMDLLADFNESERCNESLIECILSDKI